MGKPAILFITELYPNSQRPYLGSFVRNQLLELRKSYDITVITVFQQPVVRFWKYRQKSVVTDLGIDVRYIKYFPALTNLLTLLKIINAPRARVLNKKFIARLVRQKASQLQKSKNFSLVHGHEVFLGDEASEIGSLLGIPSVFTLHGLYDYHLSGFGALTMKRVLSNLKRFTAWTSVSKVAAHTYLMHGLNDKNLTIIPNGLPTLPTVEPDQEIKDFSRGRKILLSVGFLTLEKRFNQSIEVLKNLHQEQLTDTVLVIIGDGQEAHHLRTLAADKGLTNHILFLGAVSPSRLAACYSACDILLHPSVIESFSMVCLEAMAHAKPVICTSNIGLTEYVANNQDLVIVPPDDIGALTTAAARLLRDTSLSHSLGKQAQRTAARLSIESSVEQVKKVYGSLFD